MNFARPFLFIGLIGLTVACTANEPPADSNEIIETQEPTQTETPSLIETIAATNTSSPTPEPTNTAVPTATTEPKATLSTLDKLRVAIQEDIATRLGIDAEEVTITDVQSREWRDSSLGCPQEGMMYMQVLTSGYQITASANGQIFDYRANGRGHFFNCVKGRG